MEWIAGDGTGDFEFPNNHGLPIWVRDFFGGSLSPRPVNPPSGPRVTYARPADVPLVLNPVPRAFLTRRPPKDIIDPHFHELPQYQIVVEGNGSIGKHGLQPLTVHYTDAYTPYGPIVTSEDGGLAFFTIRANCDNGGTHFMPQSRGRMPRKAGRAITVHVDERDGATRDLIPRTEDGVESRLLVLNPNGTLQPDGDHTPQNRFFIVMGGSLVNDGQQLGRYSTAFASKDEPTDNLHAGTDGASVLFIQFPEYSV